MSRSRRVMGEKKIQKELEKNSWPDPCDAEEQRREIGPANNRIVYKRGKRCSVHSKGYGTGEMGGWTRV